MVNSAEKTMRTLLEMFYGFSLAADAYSNPRRYPVRGGFASDARKLHRDVRVFGADVKRTVSRAQQQQDGQAHTTKGSIA